MVERKSQVVGSHQPPVLFKSVPSSDRSLASRWVFWLPEFPSNVRHIGRSKQTKQSEYWQGRVAKTCARERQLCLNDVVLSTGSSHWHKGNQENGKAETTRQVRPGGLGDLALQVAPSSRLILSSCPCSFQIVLPHAIWHHRYLSGMICSSESSYHLNLPT